MPSSALMRPYHENRDKLSFADRIVMLERGIVIKMSIATLSRT